MNIAIEPGLYVIAVSGGVDSMALLDVLRRQPGVKLVVAHYDHGIRDDSHIDRKLVQQTAHSLKLPFVYDLGRLGANASEAAARSARYRFLEQVKHRTGAKAIITAHHQDDVLETAILNLVRGTGRRGMISLASTDGIIRPLLHTPKKLIRAYAEDKGVEWREDGTNTNVQYARNYIRHNVLPRLDDQARHRLLAHIAHQRKLDERIESHLTHHLHIQPSHDTLTRKSIIALPHRVAAEVVMRWLRKHDIRGYDRKTVERLLVAIKTARPGSSVDIDGSHALRVKKLTVSLAPRA